MRFTPRLLIAFFSLFVLVACLVFVQSRPVKAANEAATPQPEDKPKVSVQTAEKTKLTDRLIYTAQVLSQMESTLPADQSGMVADLQVNLGDRVVRGQKLFVVKSLDPVFEYRPRVQVAPVAGVIAELEVRNGSVLNKGEKTLTIVDPSKIEVEVLIPAKDRAAFMKLASCEFVQSDKKFPFVLKSVSPIIDPVTSTIKARFLPAKKDGLHNLVMGQLGQMHLQVNARESIVVPLSSVFFVGQDSFLRIVEANQTVKKMPVVITRSESDAVEINNQELLGKTIIVRTNKRVAEGDAVEIEKQPEGSKDGETLTQ